ncbi:unnamed protein product [Urochloa humidicola]
MGSRYEVEVTVGSAHDLKNVNWRHGDLKPYVVLWVDDGPKCSTRVDVDDDDPEHPVWDEKLTVPVPPSSSAAGGRLADDAVLHVDVVHANAADGVKPLVGSARLPLRDVGGVGAKAASRTLRLKRPSGRPQGKIDLRAAVREAKRYHPDPSPYSYGHPAGGSRDPAAAYYGGPPAYGAAAPSAPPYGAAAPAPVVVVPAAAGAAAQKGSNKMGMGTGLAVGAAAGVLGGLAIAGGASYLGERFDHHHYYDYDDDCDC